MHSFHLFRRPSSRAGTLQKVNNAQASRHDPGMAAVRND